MCSEIFDKTSIKGEGIVEWGFERKDQYTLRGATRTI